MVGNGRLEWEVGNGRLEWEVGNGREEHSDQVIEDVSLVDVDGDECLVLDALHLAQVLSGHLDQCGQHIQEESVGLAHHLLIGASTLQSSLCIPRPHHLDAQQAHLHNIQWHISCSTQHSA